MINYAIRFFLILSFFVLTSCVTTRSDSKSNVDKEKALEAHITLGMTYLQKNNRDGALSAFSRANKLDSRSAEAYQGLALVHQLNGERQLAEDNFKKALRGRADFSMSGVRVSYGKFLLEDGRYDEALPFFQKASEDITFPSRPNALYFIGMSALKTGDKVRAAGAFEHALNLNDRLAAASIELAEMRFVEGDYASSKKYLDQFTSNAKPTARSLLLGVKIERVFGNKDNEASNALALKNMYPYSKEYLEYKKMLTK